MSLLVDWRIKMKKSYGSGSTKEEHETTSCHSGTSQYHRLMQHSSLEQRSAQNIYLKKPWKWKSTFLKFS